MEYRKLIPQIFPESLEETAAYYDNCGADELYYYDENSFREGQEEDVKAIRAICRNADIPLNVCAKVNRFEDIKKMIYAGAKRVIVKTDGFDNQDAVTEAVGRFGTERIYLMMESGEKEETLARVQKAVEEMKIGGIVLEGDLSDLSFLQTADYLSIKAEIPVFVFSESSDGEELARMAKMTVAGGFILTGKDTMDLMEVKQKLKEEKIPVNTFESAISFDEFKLNSDGMIPVVTQDYKTGEVLMVAYMTKEAFEKTIATGKMTYFSRSRQELWTKGETSGHFQYVKSLEIDCDKDTILAKVAQIGAACHTGNRSCFFTNLVKKEYQEQNPLKVFEEVMETIEDRKAHPKEGSYTNYLFDKGIDKILKKVGEEATEIVIAAKNPDSDEIKYEICDFLYHMMVLMVQRDVTWKEITDELAERH
ncbi:MAG: bifunctional phosphoribosyl-AMP cyclohydrolase/phosphoribosyl-ATP diphosphatase HisIE [Eubacterium sp.]|nr:bifunctional phosphoribosyl-AMP cyclohydrolase/phosphoribosyl-ATP diphosphatase HisIE [Eubacterium sp.]MDD7209880.1 bifunctional phosphoribosyl-AMP cyclohydrolase/phosphoribosyl-ATP diphosphatase HisIE [Lachnospiraceae bacterium]